MRNTNLHAMARILVIDWLGGLMMVSTPLYADTGTTYAETDTTIIEITNTLKFVPGKVSIPVGTTVEWRNTSDLVHTVTDDPSQVARTEDAVSPEGADAFDSGNIRVGGKYRHTFTVPGTYRYFCIPHEGAGMVGTIVVTH